MYALKHEYDVICVNETWLDNSVNNHEIGLDGYDLIRKDRNRHGGGVAMFIRNTINYKIRSDIMPENLETITVEITKPKAKPFLLSTWYRPPNMPVNIFIDYELIIQKMDHENKEIICIGDFNCDWLSPEKSETKKLFDLANMFQLEQLIKEPTRITSQSQTLIDLAFSNRPETIIKSGVDHVGMSDHSLIYIHRKIAIPRKQPKIINTRQFKHFNVDAYKQDLAKILQNQPQDGDPNILWEDWKRKFLLVADMHAPPVTRRVRSEHAPWLTSEIKKKIYDRDFLKKKSIKTGSTHFFNAYKKARNQLNSLIKSTKAKYYNEALNQCRKDPKTMWKTINQLTNTKSKTTSINELIINQEIVTEPEKIADSLNTYFNEIGTVLAKDLPKGNNSFETYVVPTDKSFEINRLSSINVKNVILKINTSKATGHDRISPKLLKDSADIIAESLTVIFNKSIETGIFPDDLKVACISPIYKGENKTECSNYRPISVISVVAKVFEKLVSGQLMEYLETYQLLSECQAGFRKRSSTVTSLLTNTNQWYINMDKGLLNSIIFLDLKKAFDCVDHAILIEKLRKFGCVGNTLNWFKSYLTNRKQMCKVNQTTSKCRTVSCGVPQGSNLGPILFLLYVNDLPNCLKSTTASMFADDTNLTASGSTSTELYNKLNNDLENIHQWLLANKLTLNTSKTEYMIVGSRQRLGKIDEEAEIKLGDNKIKKISETKTLGVIVDDQLKWNSHINMVATKVSKGIGMIRRMKAFVPQSTLISVYNSIILPHFDYCSLVWDIGNAYSLEKLQKLQNRAARVITGKSYDIRSKDILEELSWQPLMERWGNNKAIFMHKVTNGEYLENISSLFVVKNNENYNLRNNNIDYKLEKPKTNFLKKSISYSGVKIWNELPVELKSNCLSLNAFKTLLRDRPQRNT